MSAPSNPHACLRAAQAVLSHRPAGLVTDFDGTISRIVDHPETATVDAVALDSLRRLVPCLDLVAAVSGRPPAQLLAMLPVQGMVYAGNHGLEWWEGGRSTVVPEAEPYLPAIASALQWLRGRLSAPGVLVEEKIASGSLHYRLSPDQVGARRAILQAIAECPQVSQLRVAEGRRVVNLLPPVRVDKGTTLERLVHKRRLQGVVYLGDDVTDLDAFRALRSLRDAGVCDVFLVAVASSEAPPDLLKVADHTLDGVDAVASLLREIANGLERSSRAGAP